MCIYDVYGPCSCPHGRCFTILAQCFTISSWVTSLMAITSCFYIFIRPIPEEGQPELPREGFGYISRQVGVLEPPNYRQCVWYTSDEKSEYFDSMWRAGKAMSLLACGIGGIVMCILMCTCCVAYQLPTFDAMFWTCIFCFIAQTLTFLSWGSQLCDDYECTWSSGTGMNITAAMLWVWAANMIKSFPEALPPSGRGKRRPVYDDGENDDSPYLNPNSRGGFEDEYDYGEEDNWQNDGYNDGDDYDDSYYDDSDAMSGSQLQNGSQPRYDENGQPLPYDDQQGYYDDDGNYHEPDGYLQGEQQYDENGQPFTPDGYIDDGNSGHYHQDPAYPNNEYATDYDDPSRAQGQDDDFEPNQHFQQSWKDGGVDDESAYQDSKSGSTNYFQDSQHTSGQQQSPSMGNID